VSVATKPLEGQQQRSSSRLSVLAIIALPLLPTTDMLAPHYTCCSHRSLGVDTDLLRGEALKRLKGDAEEAAPKRKKSVS
jgi:hypothetical protein